MSGQARTPAEIANIVVKTTHAALPVRIGDIASVVNSVRPVYTMVTANGKPAVLLNVNRQPDSNTVAVADAVHAEIAAIRKTLPPGVELQPFYDQSEIVNDSINSVRDAILIGLVLASHHPGVVPARLGHVAGRRPGDSGDHRHDVHRACEYSARASI